MMLIWLREYILSRVYSTFIEIKFCIKWYQKDFHILLYNIKSQKTITVQISGVSIVLVNLVLNTISVSKVSTAALKFILYFTDSSEKL